MREVVLVFDGRRDQVTLRARLRESLAEAERLRAGSRGPCARGSCRARCVELSELKASSCKGGAASDRREAAKLEAANNELRRKIARLEYEVAEVKRRRRYERGHAELCAEQQVKLEAAEKQRLATLRALDVAEAEKMQQARRAEKNMKHMKGRISHAKDSVKEFSERLATAAAAEALAKTEMRALADASEADRESARAEQQRVAKEVRRLQGRSAELTSIHHAEGRSGVHRGEYRKKGEADDIVSGELLAQKPCQMSPVSRNRRTQLVRRIARGVDVQVMRLYEAIGEDCDAEVLAQALEATDMIDKLMGTAPFWVRRIALAQELMDDINAMWGAELAARMKSDYLLSNRDLDAMRIDFSFILVNNIPRHRPLLVNPNDPKQRVLYPEPITKRTGGWNDVIQKQAEKFGLKFNEEHEDATERDWDVAVQALVERDAHLFESPETFGSDRPLQLVLGFDGAADFCHVCVRAVDYKCDVAKESEMKGVGLSVAIGNDHNHNLSLQFKRLGVKINRAIEEGGTVLLMGRQIPYRVATCLDYSASRSMNSLRSNAAPHSVKLDPHMEIKAADGASWKKVEKLVQKKLPWREFDPALPLNHISNGDFPFHCSRCSYAAATEEEEAENIAHSLALNAMKGVKAKADTAARVKIHCEKHDDIMEFETRIVRVHPRDNLVDLLHGFDINLASLLLKYSCHDAVIFAENPEVPHKLTQYYTFIDCPFDLLGDKSWFHGSVWHYDFVMGANSKSPGLDMNMLMVCLICFGTHSGTNTHPQQAEGFTAGSSADQIVDDMGDDSSESEADAAAAVDGPLEQILRKLFGHNTTKVRAIFEATCAYAEAFESINDEWTESTEEYKQMRALRTYRAGLRLLVAMKGMSNSRCRSHYLPLCAYVLPQQMAKYGDLWPYSTRAVEGRGGRLKRISRKTCCFRKRSKAEVGKSVRNLKLATVSFKKAPYNSSRTLQMFRTQMAQEESGHDSHGRSRLSTTGRKTLKRTMPKWNEAERPEIGKLLDPVALADMVARASAVFASATTFETEAVLEDVVS